MGDVRNLTIGVGFEVKTDKLTEADNVLARLIQSAKTLDSTATTSFAKIVEENRKAVSAIKESDTTAEKLSLRLKTAGEAGTKMSSDIVRGLKTVESEIVKTAGFVKTFKENFETLRNSSRQITKELVSASISGASFGDGLNKGVTQADSALAGMAERIKLVKAEMGSVEPPQKGVATTSSTVAPPSSNREKPKLKKKPKPKEKPEKGIKEIFKDSFSLEKTTEELFKNAGIDHIRELVPKKPAQSQQTRQVSKLDKTAEKYEKAVKNYGTESRQAKTLKAKMDKQAVAASKESKGLSQKAEKISESGAGDHSKKTERARSKAENADKNIKDIFERVEETEKNAKPLTGKRLPSGKRSGIGGIIDKGKEIFGKSIVGKAASALLGTGESGLAAIKNGSGLIGGIKTSIKGAGALGIVSTAYDLGQALMTKGKDKNEKVGSSVGGLIVGSAGAALGSVLGPAGTLIGGTIGSAIGNFAGGVIGKSGVGTAIGKIGSGIGKTFNGIFGGKKDKPKNTSKTTLPKTAIGSRSILANLQGVGSVFKNLLPSGKAASLALKGLSLGGKIAGAGLNALASNSKNVKLGFGSLAGTIKGSLGVIGGAAGVVASKAIQGKTKTSSSTKKTTSTKSKSTSKGSKNSKKHANGTLGALSAFASYGYASNGGHPGGLATVNDADASTYREAFLLPNGLAGLFPKKRNLTLALPKGTHVLNAQDTKQKFGAFYTKGTTGAPSAFSGKKDLTIEIKPEFNITAAAGMDLNDLQKKVLAIVNPQLEMIAQVLTKQLAGA